MKCVRKPLRQEGMPLLPPVNDASRSPGKSADYGLQWNAEVMHRPFLDRFSFAIATVEQHAQWPTSWPWRHLVPSVLRSNEGLMPYLLEIRALPEPARREIEASLLAAWQAGEIAPLSVLLATGSTAATLHRHLCQAQLVSHSMQTAWLRIFDARVWAHLPRVMNGRQLRQLFGPVDVWVTNYYRDWVETTADMATHAGMAGNAGWDWNALSRVGLVNRTLAQSDLLSWHDATQHGTRIDQLLERGQHAYGLTRTEDMVSFACYGLRYGSAFDMHPLIRRAIGEQTRPQASAEDDSNIIDLLATIDEEQWREIRHSLLEA